MRKFLVVYRSHMKGLSDVHYQSVQATSCLRAIAAAQRTHPPLFPWVLVKAYPWPKGCASLEQAVQKLKTGT